MWLGFAFLRICFEMITVTGLLPIVSGDGIVLNHELYGVAGTSRHGLHKPPENLVPQGFHPRTNV